MSKSSWPFQNDIPTMSLDNAPIPSDAMPESIVDTAERHRRWLRRGCWTGGLLAVTALLFVIGNPLFVRWQLRQHGWHIGCAGTIPLPKWAPEIAQPWLEPIEVAFLYHEPALENDIELLKRFPNLTSLIFIDTHLPDESATAISQLCQLQSIELHDVIITEVGMKSLTVCPSLRELILDQTPVSDGSLVHLPELRHLTNLRLFQTDSRGLEYVTKCLNLEWLRIDESRIIDADLASLSRLSELQTLGFTDCSLTDVGMKTLMNSCRGLRELSIAGTHLTDAAIPLFVDLPALEVLVLDGQPITDEGLRELKRCKTLKYLNLERTKVTSAGIEDLRRANPKLVIRQ